MKINKEFAPITIVLENKEDKNKFLNILEAAYRKRTEVDFFHRAPTVDTLVQQIRYLQEALK